MSESKRMRLMEHVEDTGEIINTNYIFVEKPKGTYE